MRISTTSLSVESSTGDHQISNGSSDLGRRIAYSEWMRKKHEAAQRAKEKEERAARKRQEEEEREAQEKEEKARLEKENFLKWIESKRQQEVNRKAMLENELELQRRLKEIEDNLAGAKTTYLRRWFHRKKEEQKGGTILYFRRDLSSSVRSRNDAMLRGTRGLPWQIFCGKRKEIEK